MKLKAYIYYFFWKRTWFRIFFVLIPTWIIPFVIVLHYYGLFPHDFLELDNFLKHLISLLYFSIILSAMLDNDNIDNPNNPFFTKIDNHKLKFDILCDLEKIEKYKLALKNNDIAVKISISELEDYWIENNKLLLEFFVKEENNLKKQLKTL
jgi:hypothetical protein